MVGVAIYGSYGVFIRNVSNDFRAFSQNYFRSLLIILTVSVYIFFSKNNNWVKISPKDYKWFFSWGLSGAIVMVFLYFAFNNLQLGTSYFLFYSTMIFTGLVSGKILFNEELNRNKYISLILTIAGLLMVYSVEVSSNKLIFMLEALLAGFFIGVWNTFSKKISDRYPLTQLLIVGSVFTVLIGVFGGIVFGEKFSFSSELTSYFWILGFALAELAATIFIILGFKNIEAQIASLLMPIEVVFATIFGFVLYSELPPTLTLMGGGIILLGALLPNLMTRIRS